MGSWDNVNEWRSTMGVSIFSIYENKRLTYISASSRSEIYIPEPEQ
jgi:hypothetical protein